MAMVKVFQNRTTGALVLCPFAADPKFGPGIDLASGPLLRLTLDEFMHTGVEAVTEHLDAFYTRDASIRSELYQDMTRRQRNEFLAEHQMMNISWRKGSSTVRVYVGDDLKFYGTLAFPFDKSTFAEYVLEAFARDRGETP